MDWDQVLFRKFHHWIKDKFSTPEDPMVSKRRVFLETNKDRWTYLAKSFTSESITLQPSEKNGGLSSLVFLLPPSVSAFSTTERNDLFYVYRICFLATQRVLFRSKKLSLPSFATYRESLHNEQIQQIHDVMFRELPLLGERYEDLVQEYKNLYSIESMEWKEKEDFFHGAWYENGKGDNNESIYSPKKQEELYEEEKEEETTITEKVAPPKENIQLLQVDEKTIENYTLVHQFEKVETLDEFRGRWRTMDGEDELDEHSEALEEVDLSQMIRSDAPTHSVYRSEMLRKGLIPESHESESSEHFLFYPEWDFQSKKLKQEHCKVFTGEAIVANEDYFPKTMEKHRTTFQQLQKKLRKIKEELEWKKKQVMGEELDLDAIIQSLSDRQAGKNFEDKLYLSKRKFQKEISILMLMDISLSTDSYSDGHRILDVEKQSVLLFSKLLEEQGENFQVDAFCSRTRNHCNYYSLKKFEDRFSKRVAQIGGIQPVGYTRIGPAIRHATALLEKQKTRKKWVLLLSDGKPNDYDRYEGNYGIKDVKHAIHEANDKGIQFFCFTVEKDAKHYLSGMFGKNHFQVLQRLDKLPEALLAFYSRLLR